MEIVTFLFLFRQAKQIARQSWKRPRSSSDDDDEMTGAWGSSSTPPAAADLKSAVKPLISSLVAMKWPDWSNPFMTVFKKNNAPPRYFEFVKRQMNLTFIRENLNRNKYTSVSTADACCL